MTYEGKPSPERDETDSKLREEREKADEQLGDRDATRQGQADQIVLEARARADDVLEAARERADAQLPADVSTAAPESLSTARDLEDQQVSDARAAADDELSQERAEERRALALLLALQREETNERLVMERDRADRAVASRDDFLAIVSHDIRGILGGLAMSSDLLLQVTREAQVGEQARAEAQRIRRLTGRMNRLIGDLLDVVSMESNSLRIVRQRQEVAPLLSATIETFQLASIKNEIALAVEAPGVSVFASFDHDRILQVLSNLVGNALKFTRRGGAVALRLATSDEALVFTVRDNGCGIPADKLETVFERFSQAVPNDRRGLGLGLYIARFIVEAHGGKIWAESAPGSGTALSFTLPVTAATLPGT